MRSFLLAAAVISVAACAGLQSQLTAEAAANLKDHRLATAVRRTPPLTGSIPNLSAPALGGLTGGLTAASAVSDAGERMVRENEIADPAFTIARELGNTLLRRYGLRPSPVVLAAVDDDPTRISAVDPTADLVLDVWTDAWGLEPFDFNDPRYKVGYRVNLRLIDAKVVRPIDGKSGAVIAEGTCTHLSEDTPRAPTYDQLLADHADRLKNELAAAARFCVKDFRSKILSVEPKR